MGYLVQYISRNRVSLSWKCGMASTPTLGCGAAEQLTTPHLASNADEQELVRARGATIAAPGGPGESHRVDGLIEVTRALGDMWIKDKISCHPDIYSFDLTPEHKMLILATDGLWDTVNATQAVRY